LPGPAGYSLAGYRGDAPREGKRGEVRGRVGRRWGWSRGETGRDSAVLKIF